MSYARGFGLNGKSLYTNVTMPKEVWCNFIVDHTNSNGLGIRSLKSNGYVEYVFMNTNQTPGSVNGATNPNPAAGYAVVKFKNNFNYYLGTFSGQINPAVSTSATSVTAGNVYVITALGTATLAQWQAVGLQPGLTPTVGQTFVATATQSIGGSATVGSPGVPVAPIMSIVGDPNQSISNSNIASNAGAIVVVQFSKLSVSGTISAPTFTGSAATLTGTNSAPALTMNSYTPAGTNDSATPPIFSGTPATLTGTVDAPTLTMNSYTPAGTISAPTFTNSSVYVAGAPTDGTVVSMQFCFDGSSVTIDGI